MGMFDSVAQAGQDFWAGATNDPSVVPNQATPQAVGQNPTRPDGFFARVGQEIGDAGRGIAQEGLGGLLDPAGMMDRQAAQRELKSRFDIVPDGFVGPRMPNQVTEGEFEQQAHTFSDIRTGRSDIKFDGSTDQAYRDGAMNDMANLMQTNSGRGLLGTLANNTAGEKDADGNAVHHSTTLRPYLDATGAIDPTNSDEVPIDSSGNNIMGTATESRTTDGSGSDARVQYNPGVNVQPPGATDPWWPARSDTIMMHEMTHAYYDTQGQTDTSMVQTTDGPGAAGSQPNRYEHQAAGLGLYNNAPISENAYRDERRLMGTAGAPGALPGDGAIAHRDVY